MRLVGKRKKLLSYVKDKSNERYESICCPNDPDDVKPLSEIAGNVVDETFIGSCMTNIGHFRAAGKLLEKYGKSKTRLWVPVFMRSLYLEFCLSIFLQN